jgi:hypothetical protein
VCEGTLGIGLQQRAGGNQVAGNVVGDVLAQPSEVTSNLGVQVYVS